MTIKLQILGVIILSDQTLAGLLAHHETDGLPEQRFSDTVCRFQRKMVYSCRNSSGLTPDSLA